MLINDEHVTYTHTHHQTCSNIFLLLVHVEFMQNDIACNWLAINIGAKCLHCPATQNFDNLELLSKSLRDWYVLRNFKILQNIQRTALN